MEKFNIAWRRLRRDNVSARAIALETQRRIRVALARRGERASLTALNEKPAQLTEHFARLSASDLLDHFRSRTSPRFFPGFASAEQTAALQAQLFPEESAALLGEAAAIANSHSWPLLGVYGRGFGEDQVDWNTDPLSGKAWPLSYHADINLIRNDGSDVRVLWELNRLGTFITLGRAYVMTRDERFSIEFFEQLASWGAQNPVGRGVNWACAMEVALRATNLLTAFALFLRAPGMNEVELKNLLTMFDQHGAHIKRNLEFSHLGTSNHYLSDVVGLLWLGVMLPELKAASGWRDWALAELLREMDKQILDDGADYEGSTGYHCFVLQLFLYSFILCRANDIEIAGHYWRKLHGMLVYLRHVLRPDGMVPLVGDSDGGQVLPILSRDASDRAYLLAVGAAVFKDSQFKLPGHETPPELLWLLGEKGLRNYEQLASSQEEISSRAFPEAGTYLLRDDDLYLMFNANGARNCRPASHRHNDALSIEVSAGGRAFIVDPGSFVYTADLHERHLFRSTAYHSTVEVDSIEQNSIDENLPFTIGNEAHTRVLEWETGPYLEKVTAEHDAYQRLPQPVTFRRSVVFNKQKRYWLITDTLRGEGQHDLSFRFHFAPGLESEVRTDGILVVRDKLNGVRLLIRADELNGFLPRSPQSDSQFSSQNYGNKTPSRSACWFVRTALPFETHFVIVPVAADEDDDERLSLALSWED